MTIGPAETRGFEDIITAAAPPLSLLRIPGVLYTPTPEQSHWLSGVSFEPEACSVELSLATADASSTTDFPYWWNTCTEGGTQAVDVLASGVKGIAAPPDPVVGPPFTLWAGYQCTSLDVGHGSRMEQVQ